MNSQSGTLRTRLADAWRQRAVALKAVSFATVGVINTAVDACIFFLMLRYVTPTAGFMESVSGFVVAVAPYVPGSWSTFLIENAPLIVANIVGWWIANTGSYVMNSFTTFSAETGGKLSLKHYAGFVGSGLVAVTVSTITLVIAARFMPVWAAKGLAILVSFVVNFSITHFVVFRTKPKPADAA